MLICIKYSHDSKNIDVLHIDDATGIILLDPKNLSWTQKSTGKKYELGEFAEDIDKRKPNQPITVFDSENVCHYRLFKFFIELQAEDKMRKKYQLQSS